MQRIKLYRDFNHHRCLVFVSIYFKFLGNLFHNEHEQACLMLAASVVLWLACWPLVPKIAASNPAGLFSGVKVLSVPSFGKEVKQFLPCRNFAARKTTLLDYVEVGFLRPNYSDISRSKFPPSLTEDSSDRVGSGLSVEVPLHSSSMGALELKGGNQNDAVHKGTV
jgi:hypothetical protein